jgi:hypothetical protein
MYTPRTGRVAAALRSDRDAARPAPGMVCRAVTNGGGGTAERSPAIALPGSSTVRNAIKKK